jgi:hypothetical protein
VFPSEVVEETVPGVLVLPCAEPWFDEPDGFTDVEDPAAPFELFGDELWELAAWAVAKPAVNSNTAKVVNLAFIIGNASGVSFGS